MDINTIAEMAGVSRATVSRYLNDGYVSEEKRKLIAKVIEETGYVPSQRAQTLRTGRSNLVGVIIPKIDSTSVSRMVWGLSSVLNDSGYQMLLAVAENNEEREVEYLRLFSEKRTVDGLILIATVLTPAHQELLGALSIPHVILGQSLAGHSCVYHDDYGAVHDITAHALRAGTRPAYIGVTEADLAAGRDRHRGFLDACHEAGIEVPDRAQEHCGFTIDSGYMAAERLLNAYPEMDTLVCATDDIASGAMACLREYGHTVPGDVQVTGLGDSDLSKVMTPTLTTIHHHYYTCGAEAARILVDAMGTGEEVVREVRVSHELLTRGSTRWGNDS